MVAPDLKALPKIAKHVIAIPQSVVYHIEKIVVRLQGFEGLIAENLLGQQ